jgi:c-di-GMP-binding flagellar brake protein YcgR
MSSLKQPTTGRTEARMSKPATHETDERALVAQACKSLIGQSRPRPPSAKERRQHRRIELPGGTSWIVGIVLADSSVRQMKVSAVDVSHGGAGFLAEGFVHVGTRCALALRDREGKPFVKHGEVARCEHHAGMTHLIGVRFSEALTDAQMPKAA